ncbi:hypothetical protein GCM10023094_09220 [Rhodococcus olei]|uniref:Uncharacterized protein n=1 Tax=Rhodococcus olei TaxID=2161675 RepID=A0ABP8NXQ0_9NOCA
MTTASTPDGTASRPKGVPISLTTALDFMQVRAALVRHLGGGNQALVFTRIQYRCGEPGKDRIEDPTGRWWRASLDVIARETGLSKSAVRTALRNLEAAGAVVSMKHHLHNNISDQTLSYRVVMQGDAPTEAPHFEMSDSASAEVSELAPVLMLNPADLSSPDSLKTKAKTRSSSSAPSAPSERDDVEAMVQRLYRRIEENGFRADSFTDAWRNEARLLLDKDGIELQQALDVIDWCQNNTFWRKNVLSMPKFRKQYNKLHAGWLESHRQASSVGVSTATKRLESIRALDSTEDEHGIQPGTSFMATQWKAVA